MTFSTTPTNLAHTPKDLHAEHVTPAPSGPEPSALPHTGKERAKFDHQHEDAKRRAMEEAAQRNRDKHNHFENTRGINAPMAHSGRGR